MINDKLNIRVWVMQILDMYHWIQEQYVELSKTNNIEFLRDKIQFQGFDFHHEAEYTNICEQLLLDDRFIMIIKQIPQKYGHVKKIDTYTKQLNRFDEFMNSFDDDLEYVFTVNDLVNIVG